MQKCGSVLAPNGSLADIVVTGLGFTPAWLVIRAQMINIGDRVMHGVAGIGPQTCQEEEVVAGNAIFKASQHTLICNNSGASGALKLKTYDTDGFTLEIQALFGVDHILQFLAGN